MFTSLKYLIDEEISVLFSIKIITKHEIANPDII